MRALILPGMDGSGRLLREFVDALAPEVHADVVSYPRADALGYDGLVALVLERLPRGETFALIGESFSGPIAIRVAASRPAGLAALVLCATFASSPQPWFRPLRPLLAMPFPMPPTAWMMPAMMGRWTTPGWTRRERLALRELPARVARRRLSEVLRVDATADLAHIDCPILYLQASHDRLVPPRCWHEIQRIVPTSRRVRLEGPHFILQHQAGAAAAAIADFLANVDIRA